MALTLGQREAVREQIERWVWPRPLQFDEFIELFMGRDEIVELVRGTVIVEMAAQYEHEDLIAWLLSAARVFAEDNKLGKVLGSRMAVKIDDFNGRLPDLLFVRSERLDIIKADAIYGAPDLVIEVRSPGDRRSDLIELETDYRNRGVPEIVFIDPKRRIVRILSHVGNDYKATELSSGELAFHSLPGFKIDLTWLFAADRPSVSEVLNSQKNPAQD